MIRTFLNEISTDQDDQLPKLESTHGSCALRRHARNAITRV